MLPPCGQVMELRIIIYIIVTSQGQFGPLNGPRFSYSVTANGPSSKPKAGSEPERGSDVADQQCESVEAA